MSELLLLQNKIKRDPQAYREEFLQQWNHFESAVKIFELKPSEDSKSFSDLVLFLCQVSASYPKDTEYLPAKLMKLIDEHHMLLDPKLRSGICQGLILLRNRNQLTPIFLLPLFFKLFRCPDKALRHLVFTHIVADVKRMNHKHKDNRLNKTLQNFMYQMLKDDNVTAAHYSLKVMIDLHRRRIWDDARTVNVISTAILRREQKLFLPALNFFLKSGSGDDDEFSDDEEGPATVTKKDMYNAFHKGVKVSSLKQKRVKENLKKKAKRAERALTGEDAIPNFPAIDLMNDPFGFAEQMLKKLRSSTDRFEFKIMMMDLISRLIGSHQLILLNFYPFLQRYLQPHQKEVSKIMACLVQACHDLVPPEDLEPVVRSVADNFVSDRCSNEAMAIGLNTIREVACRQPLVLSQSLLHDLSQFKTAHDKGVIMAARSLIAVYRLKNPKLLQKKDRGRDGAMGMALGERTQLQYGDLKASTRVAGVALLEEREREDREAKEAAKTEREERRLAGDIEVDDSDLESEGEGQEGGAADWEEVSDSDSDGSGGWVDITDDEAPQPDEDNSDDDSEELAPDTSLPLEAQRILTPKDFERLKALKEEQDKAGPRKKGGSSKKRKRDKEAEEAGINQLPNTFMDPTDLEGWTKKRRTLAERVASMEEGREGREKFGSMISKKTGGTTNKEKKRNQPFQMVKKKQSVMDKGKRSMREKQSMANASLKKVRKMEKKKHRFGRSK